MWELCIQGELWDSREEELIGDEEEEEEEEETMTAPRVLDDSNAVQ